MSRRLPIQPRANGANHGPGSGRAAASVTRSRRQNAHRLPKQPSSVRMPPIPNPLGGKGGAAQLPEITFRADRTTSLDLDSTTTE